jgi:hypothetical protein
MSTSEHSVITILSEIRTQNSQPDQVDLNTGQISIFAQSTQTINRPFSIEILFNSVRAFGFIPTCLSLRGSDIT